MHAGPSQWPERVAIWLTLVGSSLSVIYDISHCSSNRSPPIPIGAELVPLLISHGPHSAICNKKLNYREGTTRQQHILHWRLMRYLQLDNRLRYFCVHQCGIWNTGKVRLKIPPLHTIHPGCHGYAPFPTLPLHGLQSGGVTSTLTVSTHAHIKGVKWREVFTRKRTVNPLWFYAPDKVEPQ